MLICFHFHFLFVCLFDFQLFGCTLLDIQLLTCHFVSKWVYWPLRISCRYGMRLLMISVTREQTCSLSYLIAITTRKNRTRSRLNIIRTSFSSFLSRVILHFSQKSFARRWFCFSWTWHLVFFFLTSIVCFFGACQLFSFRILVSTYGLEMFAAMSIRGITTP